MAAAYILPSLSRGGAPAKPVERFFTAIQSPSTAFGGPPPLQMQGRMKKKGRRSLLPAAQVSGIAARSGGKRAESGTNMA
jgi:hypothetical protein